MVLFFLVLFKISLFPKLSSINKMKSTLKTENKEEGLQAIATYHIVWTHATGRTICEIQVKTT